jgi:hypothetical protein
MELLDRCIMMVFQPTAEALKHESDPVTVSKFIHCYYKLQPIEKKNGYPSKSRYIHFVAHLLQSFLATSVTDISPISKDTIISTEQSMNLRDLKDHTAQFGSEYGLDKTNSTELDEKTLITLNIMRNCVNFY